MTEGLRITAALLCAANIFGYAALAEPSTPEDIDMVREDHSDRVEQTIDVNLDIHEDRVIRNIDNLILGWQFEDMSDSIFVDESSEELSDDFKEFADTIFELPLARHGGTSLNGINFFDQMGPRIDRKMSRYIDFRYNDSREGKQTNVLPRQFGLVEWIKMVQAINPDAKLIPCISLQTTTPEDILHLVSFLLDEKDESEWGAMRAEYGIEKPVNLYALEMGNEMDLYSQNEQGNFYYDEKLADWYGQKCRAVIDTVKPIYPEVKYMASGKTGYEDREQWTDKLCEYFGDDLDYVALHLYYSGYHPNFTINYVDTVTDVCKKHYGEDYIPKIVVTEHATWPTSGFDDSKMISLYAALASAQAFNKWYARPEIVGANYHNVNGRYHMWSQIQLLDGKWVKSAVEQNYEAYNANLGDRIVEIDLSADEEHQELVDQKMTSQVLTAAAMPKGRRTMKLILNNMTEEYEFKVKINSQAKYKLVEETIFTGPNLQSYVCTADTEDVVTTTVNTVNVPNFTEYTVPSKSTVYLTLEADRDLPDINGVTDHGEDAAYEGEGYFDDISGSYAENEINLLAEEGMINGVSERRFAPKNAVTRAEFAQMLMNITGINSMEYKDIFDDVPEGAWYTDAVISAWKNGFLRGRGNGIFAPDDKITMEEMAIIVKNVCFALNPTMQTNIGNEFLDDIEFNDEPSERGREAIAFCIKNNFLKSAAEMEMFSPKKAVTRQGAAAMMYRLKRIK
ncbi:MAG: S-layer homology domain-containing protein [Clostridiales bacterium]|nr:S-layer homology domain-containing protein [Clostridiales bacterium]